MKNKGHKSPDEMTNAEFVASAEQLSNGTHHGEAARLAYWLNMAAERLKTSQPEQIKAALKLLITEREACEALLAELDSKYVGDLRKYGNVREEGYEPGGIHSPGLDAARAVLEQAQISEAEEKRRGEEIARILGLKQNSLGRFDTTHGDKTALGLFRTVERFVVDGK